MQKPCSRHMHEVFEVPRKPKVVGAEEIRAVAVTLVRNRIMVDGSS